MSPDSVGEALGRCAGGSAGALAGLGGEGLTCRDLMHALGAANVPEVGRRLVRLKYLHETSQVLSLTECHLLVPLLNRAAEDHWELDRSRQLVRLAQLALTEWLQPDVCLNCAGEGSRIINAKSVVCPACTGTGVPLSRDLLQLWGGPLGPWEDRLERLIGEIRDWEGQTLGAVARKLREPQCA